MRGPAGHRFFEALTAVGAHKGFSANPTHLWQWVDQPWNGRHLTIRTSTIGGQALTTGHRWITIRLSTQPLGVWATPPKTSGDGHLEGVWLPITPQPPSTDGFFRDDHRLAAALWSFASRVIPPGAPTDGEALGIWLQLHARRDAVLWHLRVRQLDAGTVTEAIDLLTWLASYVEHHDQTLSARLGVAPGVRRLQRLRLITALVALVFFAIPMTLLILVALMGGC